MFVAHIKCLERCQEVHNVNRKDDRLFVHGRPWT